MTEAARKCGVATHMGIQGHAGEGVRLIQEWLKQDAIGKVREVHVWTNRPGWPQGVGRPTDEHPIPNGLDWECWLGPRTAQLQTCRFAH